MDIFYFDSSWVVPCGLLTDTGAAGSILEESDIGGSTLEDFVSISGFKGYDDTPSDKLESGTYWFSSFVSWSSGSFGEGESTSIIGPKGMALGVSCSVFFDEERLGSTIYFSGDETSVGWMVWRGSG